MIHFQLSKYMILENEALQGACYQNVCITTSDCINQCANNKYKRERALELPAFVKLIINILHTLHTTTTTKQSFKLSMFSNMSYRVTFRFTSLPYCV